MARREIAGNWTRDDRIAINENFRQLFEEYTGAGLNAKEAREKAHDAIMKSDEALALSERTQKELSQAILEGDSSPLGGQLSVGADGTIYTDPQDRLVKEFNSVNQQLAQKPTHIDIENAVEPKADIAFVNNELVKKRSIFDLIDINDFTPEAQAAIAGTAPIANSIPANESVTPNTLGGEVKNTYALLTDAFNEVVTSKNLYDKSLAVDKKYISTVDGSELNADNLGHTGFIPIEPSTKYTISGNIEFSTGTFWNGDTFLHAFTANDTQYEINTPSNATHMTLNMRLGEGHTHQDFLNAINSIQLERGSQATSYEPYRKIYQLKPSHFNPPVQQRFKWTNKKWFAIGDSNTEENIHATKKYPQIIAEKTGVIATNHGKSGYGYVRNDAPTFAFHHLIPTLPNDADLITIFGGGNDVRNVRDGILPLGELGDSTLDTFYGAVDYTLNMLVDKYTTKRIALITQTRRGAENEDEFVKQMAAAQIEVAHKYGVPALDLYNEGNMFMYNEDFRNYAATDNVHFNDNGQAILADKIMSFLETI